MNESNEDYRDQDPCPTCKSRGFETSVLGEDRCEFCDGTAGGNPPSQADIATYKTAKIMDPIIPWMRENDGTVLHLNLHPSTHKELMLVGIPYYDCNLKDRSRTFNGFPITNDINLKEMQFQWKRGDEVIKTGILK